MSASAVAALVANDFKDLRRNLTILPILFIAPLLALLMQKIAPSGVSPAETMPMWLVYGQILVGMNIVALGISEEKEKKTLEALLVSPVSLWDVIGAKLIFAVVVTVVVQAATIAVAGGLMGSLGALAGTIFVGTVFFALVGLIVGVASPNQKAAGAISTPIMLLFLLAPLASAISPTLKAIVSYVPSYNVGEIIHAALAGEVSIAKYGQDIVCLVGWTAVTGFAAWWILGHQTSK